MKLFNRKYIAFFAAIALFAMVTLGGCGSSHDDAISDGGGGDSVSGVNAAISGVWLIDPAAESNHVTADINGTEVELAIKTFDMRFQSVDVAEDYGELNFNAFAILSSDRVIIPLALEGIHAETEYIYPSTNTWAMDAQGGKYTIQLGGTDSAPVLTLVGQIKLFGSYEASISVKFNKATSSVSRTSAEIDNIINGTWQTTSDLNGRLNGGFVFVSGDTVQDTSRSDKPLVEGMTEIDAAFGNMIFEETNTAENSTRITTQAAVGTLTESNDFVGPVTLIMNHNYDGAKVSVIYHNIYKFEFSGQANMYLLVSQDNVNAGYLLSTTIVPSENGGYTDVRTVLAVDKMPDKEESTFDIKEQIGTVWHSTNLAVGQVSSGGITTQIRFEDLAVMFPAQLVNLEDRTFTATIAGRYYAANSKPENRIYQEVSFDLPIKYVEKIGYNSWYVDDSDTEAGTSYAIITVLNEYALITAHVVHNDRDIDIVAFMSKWDEIEDLFFSGAWTCTSSDAKVNISTPAYPGDPGFAGDVALLTFGAYFSSVDITAGTAKFSAFTVLSSDLCLIPVVFDNETVSIARGTTSYDFVVTSPHGSFTVAGTPDDLNSLRMNGIFDYQDRGLMVNVDAKITRFQASQQLDFDSIMKGSTWQSAPFESQSGGFGLIGTSSFAAFYPGINSKTFASIAFDGDSTGGVISGFGTMGLLSLDLGTGAFVDSGAMLPIGLVKAPIDVSQIFGNYYKFDFTSGDSVVKGVFILEDESRARMIMLATNGSTETVTILYSAFYLYKVTESAQVDLTAFNNTSWDVTQAGGVVALADGNILQITNESPDNHSIRLHDAIVQITNANEAARTVDFKITAYSDVPLYGERAINQYLEFPTRTVSVEKLGEYMWLGTEGDNSFILTMSASYMGCAALMGNLNFASPNNPYFNITSSVLFDLVLHQ